MKLALRILLAAAILTGVMGKMIADHVMALSSGREIVVAAAPVDPRDLFRGDYVTLAYPFSAIQADQVAGLAAIPKNSWSEERTIYVQLKLQAGRYVLAAASASWPDNVPDGVVVLKGTTSGETGLLRIRYGVERYFVPEGEGRAIEDGVRERAVDLVLSVAPDGTPAIKALRLDGQEVYREGLL